MLRKQPRRHGQPKRLAEILLIPAPPGVPFEAALRFTSGLARSALSLVFTPRQHHSSACDAQCQARLCRPSFAIRRSFRRRSAIRNVRPPRKDGLLLGRRKRRGALAQFACPTVDRKRSRRRNAARMKDNGKESLAYLPAADRLAHLSLVRLACKPPNESPARRSSVVKRARDGSRHVCRASGFASPSTSAGCSAWPDETDIHSEPSASSPLLSQPPLPLPPPSLTLRRSASPCVAGFHNGAPYDVGKAEGLAPSTEEGLDQASSSFVRERGRNATQTSAVAALELTGQHQRAVEKPRRLSECSTCRHKRGSAVEDVERSLDEEHDGSPRRRSTEPCHTNRPTSCLPSGSPTRQCERVARPRQRQKQAKTHDGTAWQSPCAVRSTQANPDDLTIPTSDRRSFGSTTVEASDSIEGGASGGGGGGGGGETDSSFQTASETVESEEGADTSGSAMAEHGHSSRGGNSSAGGGSGGGHGGDDSRSSASLSLGRAGEDINGRRYHLRIVQQPSTGSAFGLRTLTRLAIQPPLVVQLRVTNLDNEDVEFDEEIPFLVCRLRLSTEDGMPADMLAPTATTATTDPEQAPLSAHGPRHSTGNLDDRRQSPPTEQARSQRVVSATPALPSSDSAGTITEASVARSLARQSEIQAETPLSMLYGTLVASPVSLPNQRQRMRTFFIFPEVSVRSSGRFRLHVALMRLPLPTLAAPSATTTAGQASAEASQASASASPSVPLQAAESASNTPSALRPTPAALESPSDVREPPRQDQRQSAYGITLATVQSEPFSIVSNADYVAPHITELTRHFAVNGVSLLLPPGHSSND